MRSRKCHSWAKWGLSLAVAVGLIWIGWHVSPVLVTLHVLVCFVLIIVIMLQSGNAADLAGAFGGAGSQTAFGPRGAATFLSRATTWCAIVFMMTSLTLSVKRDADGSVGGTGSVLEQTQKPGTAPADASLRRHPAPVPGADARRSSAGSGSGCSPRRRLPQQAPAQQSAPSQK